MLHHGSWFPNRHFCGVRAVPITPPSLHLMGVKGLSHQATAWVLWFSESRLADRLVLHSLAYRLSNDDGDCYPSIATLMEESNLSERQTYDSIKMLCAMGELLVREEFSSKGTNQYHMPKAFKWIQEIGPAKSAGGAKSAGCKPRKMQVQDVQNAGAKSADESSLESSIETSPISHDPTLPINSEFEAYQERQKLEAARLEEKRSRKGKKPFQRIGSTNISPIRPQHKSWDQIRKEEDEDYAKLIERAAAQLRAEHGNDAPGMGQSLRKKAK